jgi:hypothetical protein
MKRKERILRKIKLWRKKIKIYIKVKKEVKIINREWRIKWKRKRNKKIISIW